MLYGEYIYMEMLAMAIKLLCSSVIKSLVLHRQRLQYFVCIYYLLTQDLCLNV